MNEQYFARSPLSASAERTLELEFAGRRYCFITDNGVFSKGGLDEGSRALLLALPELHGRVLDLGCGWGALGVILGGMYPEARFVLADVNERALELARRNIALNGLKNAEVRESDVYAGIEGQFDFIITNPPIRTGKRLIYSMFDGAPERLSPSGRLILVIRKQQGAPSTLKHIGEVFEYARVISRSRSYWVISAARQDAQRGCAEPV